MDLAGAEIEIDIHQGIDAGIVLRQPLGLQEQAAGPAPGGVARDAAGKGAGFRL